MSGGGREGDALWAAVGDPTRRRLLDTLLTLGEATATTLARELPVTRQAVAKHLAVLGRAGLVDGRRDGREVRYAVRAGRLDEVSQAMTRVASGWEERLAAIKRLAESAHGETNNADDSPRRPPRRPETTHGRAPDTRLRKGGLSSCLKT